MNYKLKFIKILLHSVSMHISVLTWAPMPAVGPLLIYQLFRLLGPPTARPPTAPYHPCLPFATVGGGERGSPRPPIITTLLPSLDGRTKLEIK